VLIVLNTAAWMGVLLVVKFTWIAVVSIMFAGGGYVVSRLIDGYVNKPTHTGFFVEDIFVTWSCDKYKVDREEVRNNILDFLRRTRDEFPNARQALRNATIVFREPLWRCATETGQLFVDGLQIGSVAMVGWATELDVTSLRHELYHICSWKLTPQVSVDEQHARMWDLCVY
jgi:hypothetical protein